MTASARASASGDNRDAAATASTLNYALGRKHMKSWMTGQVNGSVAASSTCTPKPTLPAASKRGRGRPRKYPLPDAATQQHATQAASPVTNAPSAERLPASNSTSPQLANIVTATQQNPSRDKAEVTVLPSPTPSEENATNAEVQFSETATRQGVDIDGFDISPQLREALGITLADIHSVPKGPAHAEGTPLEKRVRIDFTQYNPARAVANASPPIQLSPQFNQFPEFPQRSSVPHVQQGSPPLGHMSNRSPSFGQPLNRQTASPQLVQSAHQLDRPLSSLSNPSPVQTQHVQYQPGRQLQVSPPLPSQPFAVPSSPHAQQAVQPHYVLPTQRRASAHDDWYSPGHCLQILTSFNAMNAAPAASTTVRHRDSERLQVMEEAVIAQDWAYLMLHQYYCLMTRSPQTLPPSLNLRCGPHLHSAYALMREVLDDNSSLSLPCIDFFCTFPYPIEYLASHWPTRFQHAEHDFVEFVKHSAQVGQLRQLAEGRRIPPVPREFAYCAVTSLTFQRLLLRSIIRTLWAIYPQAQEMRHFENQVIQHFDQAQMNFNHLRSTGQLGGRQQAEQEFRAWCFTFTEVTGVLETTLRSLDCQPVNALSHQTYYQQQVQQHIQQQNQARQIEMARRRQIPPPRTASQVQASRQASNPLLPKPGTIQPQQRVPAPMRFGLHQAHLRSPVLQTSTLHSPVYYFWQGFIRRPQRLKDPNNAIARLSFKFSKKEMEFVAKEVSTAPGAPLSRVVDENHKLIRLRCIKWASNEEPTDAEWATADNSWIPHSYFTFNSVSLQLRKKLYSGKDLPVDLTGLVRVDQNTLEVSVMSNSSDTTHRNYLVAIEFLGIMTQAAIKERVHKKSIPATKTINDIKWKLSPHDSDDDDIAIVESTLTVNLRDPFSASNICDTPVRSTACLHNECFDLDTFLETRPRKGDVTAADQWRCPICKADARPNVLVVDEFLVGVRRELEKKGLLETRAIIVEQDGSWKPKPEERDPNGVQDRDTPEPTPATIAAPAATATRPKQPVVYEIIDLESD